MKLHFTSSIVARRRLALILLGLLLNATIISAVSTFYVSFDDFSARYIGGDRDEIIVYNPKATTVLTGSVPMYLALSLLEVPGVIETSPEILAPTVTLDGQHLTARGIVSNFFDLVDLNRVQGQVDYLDSNQCLVGVRAIQRLGKQVGEWLTIQSVMQNTLQELQISGVYSTGTPLDDEIIIPLDKARDLRGISLATATLIRVSLDKDNVNESQLREKLTKNFKVYVNLEAETSWGTVLQVITPTGKIVERRQVTVPGEYVLELSLGRYVLQIENVSQEVYVDSDKATNIQVEESQRRISVRVVNATDDAPIVGAEVEIVNTQTGESSSFTTDELGQAESNCPVGEYLIRVQSYGSIHEKTLSLKADSEVTFQVGPIPLTIQVYYASTGEPVKGATIKAAGTGISYTGLTDAQGVSALLLKEGSYNVSASSGEYFVWRLIDLEEDPIIILLLGDETASHCANVKVQWQNGTLVTEAKVTARGDTLNLVGYTNRLGSVDFQGLPAGQYVVLAQKGDYSKSTDMALNRDVTLTITLPSMAIFSQELSIEWVKYLPEDLGISLSGEVFNESMRIMVLLVTSTLLLIGTVISLAATLNSYDIITNAVSENSRSFGIIRSLGASSTDTYMILGRDLTAAGIATGLLGYALGYAIIGFLSGRGTLMLAGYTLVPRFSLLALALTVSLSVITVVASLIRVVGSLLDTSVMELLRGLSRKDILLLPRNLTYPAAAFIIPVLVRAVPEALNWPNPIGYDTLSAYIPAQVYLRTGFERLVYDVIYQRPFFWVVSLLPYPLGLEAPFKVFPLLLHGLLGLSVYVYTDQIFHEKERSLGVALLATLYFISLRVSWDLHANELGLVLVFTALLTLKKGLETWSKTLMALTVVTAATLTHEGASILLFVAAIPQAIKNIREGRGGTTRHLVALAIPLTFFIYRLFDTGFPLIASALGSSKYPSATYLELATSAAALYLYTTIPLIPLAALGLLKGGEAPSMKAWLVAASAAALSPLIFPGAAISFWQRWAYMAVYPLSFYAVVGLDVLKAYGLEAAKRRINLRTLAGALFSAQILYLSIMLIFSPPGYYQPYQSLFGEDSRWISRHIPTTMLMSTISPTEAEAATSILAWLNHNATKGTVLIVDEEFRGYAALHTDTDRILVYDVGGTWYNDPSQKERATEVAASFAEKGYTVYLLARPFPTQSFKSVQTVYLVCLYRFLSK